MGIGREVVFLVLAYYARWKKYRVIWRVLRRRHGTSDIKALQRVRREAYPAKWQSAKTGLMYSSEIFSILKLFSTKKQAYLYFSDLLFERENNIGFCVLHFQCGGENEDVKKIFANIGVYIRKTGGAWPPPPSCHPPPNGCEGVHT